MVENVEDLGAELNREPLRDLLQLRHGHIQTPEGQAAEEVAGQSDVANPDLRSALGAGWTLAGGRRGAHRSTGTSTRTRGTRIRRSST